MKFKWITAGCMALILSIGMFSETVFAFVDETAVEDMPSQQSEQLEEPADEPMQPLTPDGNLTLVDDEGDVPKAGKQFITVVTKTGNYFYLIIDRDDEGKETVHFLNQVDEADLLKLIDEEELEQLAPEKEQEPEPEAEPASTMPPDMLREPAQRPPASVEQSADLVISTFSGSAPPKNKARQSRRKKATRRKKTTLREVKNNEKENSRFAHSHHRAHPRPDGACRLPRPLRSGGV